MPPFIVVVLGAIGAATVVKWVMGEVRRINAELDCQTLPEAADHKTHPTLRRDPNTGVYRPV
jgi:hypothetical protein